MPDRVGRWRLTDSAGEVIEVEIYTLPNGELAAWCEDLGLGGVDESIYWDDDTFVGHVPVWEFGFWYTCEFVA